MTRRPDLNAPRAFSLANVVAELLASALAGLDQAAAGWPTSTPGAAPDGASGVTECVHTDCTENRPCLVHDVKLTTDRAATDRATLEEHLEAAVRNLARAAAITTFWGLPGISKTATAERLKLIDAPIWCTNCRSHGINEPRSSDRGLVCNYCRDFRRDWGEYPPFEILDAKTRRRLSEQDIKRTLRAIHDRQDEADARKVKLGAAS